MSTINNLREILGPPAEFPGNIATSLTRREMENLLHDHPRWPICLHFFIGGFAASLTNRESAGEVSHFWR